MEETIYKAIFFDIDGTLLSHASNCVPDSAAAAIRALQARGVKVFAATGRHILELRALPLERVDFDGYITLNGSLCLDREERVIFSRTYDPHDAALLAQAFAAHALPMIITEKERFYINYADDNVRRTMREIDTEVPEISTYGGAPFYQASIFVPDPQAYPFISRLAHTGLVKWNPTGFDFTIEGLGKSDGILAVLEHFGLPLAQSIVFGDGENDLDMLRMGAFSVAMGNAPAHIQAAASMTCGHIDRDGVAGALWELFRLDI